MLFTLYISYNNVMEKMHCQSPMSHLAHNSAHSALVRPSVVIELESVKTRISAPAHPSATGIGRVSGFVENCSSGKTSENRFLDLINSLMNTSFLLLVKEGLQNHTQRRQTHSEPLLKVLRS